ncbi:hypothetical protein JCM10003_3412 [Bacteroides pyogenes JCM 10003]|nr:hypothetical protein JCM10003_3412 [Bacteroides pyogenes JCM 10003]
MYSFSWLQNVDITNKGVKLRNGSYFTLNFYDVQQVKNVVKNILEQPEMFADARVVVDIRIQYTPLFSEKEPFGIEICPAHR